MGDIGTAQAVTGAPPGRASNARQGPCLLGAKRRREDKDAAEPGLAQSGTSSETVTPKAAGRGGQAGQPLWGTGGRHTHLRSSKLHPRGPAACKRLPARLRSGLDGSGPAQLPRLCAVARHLIRNEQRRTEWGEGRKARMEGRREDRVSPCQPPTEGKPSSQGRAGCRERQSGPCCSRGRPASSAQGCPSALTGTHTTQCPGPSSAQDGFTKCRA